MAATFVVPIPNIVSVQSSSSLIRKPKFHHFQFKLTSISSSSSSSSNSICCARFRVPTAASLDSPQSPNTSFTSSTRLYVSGLSFRTTQEGLRNAFEKFGNLVEVNLVMDRIANRPRGFAFLRYTTEEESKKAIDGMHGKFLDGRVIFVEVAKPRSELRKSQNQSSRSLGRVE